MRTKLFAAVALLALTVQFAPSAADDFAQVGRWSAPFWEGGAASPDPTETNSRAYPAAGTLIQLPDGRLLYWNALEGSENGDLWVAGADGRANLENSRARILDLSGETPTWSVPDKERGTTDQPRDGGRDATKDMFCADQKLLYDGTLLVAGGSSWGDDAYGDEEARIFDPETNAFTNTASMSNPRWYPSLITLGDGRVMVASGLKRLIGTMSDATSTSWSQVREVEIYDPAAKTWSSGNTTELSLPLYPRMHLLPNGSVFYGGSGQTWAQFGETPDEAAWGTLRTYNPSTKQWTIHGPTLYGTRGAASSTLLRLEQPYDQARILLAGGTLGPTPGSVVANTISEVVTFQNGQLSNEATPKLPLAGVAGDQSQLRQQRWFGTSVMLPTGQVLLFNGADLDDVMDPGSAAGVRTAELYDPSTNTWRTVATAGRDRGYHNTALLLPDGRVLIGGNAPHPAHYLGHDNTLSRSNNFRDATFEIYEPPYLFQGPRPTISTLSIDAGGRSVTLGASENDEVVLVRLAAITHAQDADMRSVVLQRTVNGDGSTTASLPNNGDGRIVPPGPYYVFTINDGVPSVARTVLVQPDTVNGGVVFANP
jgi:hypothetical protein